MGIHLTDLMIEFVRAGSVRVYAATTSRMGLHRTNRRRGVSAHLRFPRPASPAISTPILVTPLVISAWTIFSAPECMGGGAQTIRTPTQPGPGHNFTVPAQGTVGREVARVNGLEATRGVGEPWSCFARAIEGQRADYPFTDIEKIANIAHRWEANLPIRGAETGPDCHCTCGGSSGEGRQAGGLFSRGNRLSPQSLFSTAWRAISAIAINHQHDAGKPGLKGRSFCHDLAPAFEGPKWGIRSPANRQEPCR